MPYTNTTPNMGLPQYVESDTPQYLSDFNGAMLAIDTKVAGINTAKMAKATYDPPEAGQAIGPVEQAGGIASFLATFLAAGAGAHNSIYRGKYLGSAVTAAQYAAISSGTFADLYIGDYWTIGGVNYRIAAFDYFYNTGDTALTTHHVTLVPDSILYNAQMNTTSTTAGGYAGSDMYTANLVQAKTIINAAFPNHLLRHRQLLTNAVNSNGQASGWAWFDSEVELMNETMVYGSVAAGSSAIGANLYNMAGNHGILPLFAIHRNLVNNRASYWLRDVATAAYFADVGSGGFADCASASSSRGVRPYFSIAA